MGHIIRLTEALNICTLKRRNGNCGKTEKLQNYVIVNTPLTWLVKQQDFDGDRITFSFLIYKGATIMRQQLIMTCKGC